MRLCRKLGVIFGIVIAFMAVFAVAIATAMVVIYIPGTGAPRVPAGTPVQLSIVGYKVDHIVDYPASLAPLVGTDQLGDSVAYGNVSTVQCVNEAFLDGEQEVTLVGLSQGSVVLSEYKRGLAGAPNAPPPDSLKFVQVADPTAPNGGVLSRFERFGGVPVVGIPFYAANPDDSRYETIIVNRRYDGFVDFPVHILNPLAFWNAMLGIAYYHGNYSTVNLDVDDPQNTVQKVGNTTYILHDEKLPLFMPLRQLGFIQLADKLDAVFRPFVELGYERANPGANIQASFTFGPSDPQRYITAITESVAVLLSPIPAPASPSLHEEAPEQDSMTIMSAAKNTQFDTVQDHPLQLAMPHDEVTTVAEPVTPIKRRDEPAKEPAGQYAVVGNDDAVVVNEDDSEDKTTAAPDDDKSGKDTPKSSDDPKDSKATDMDDDAKSSPALSPSNSAGSSTSSDSSNSPSKSDSSSSSSDNDE